jgi:hypothetical protein
MVAVATDGGSPAQSANAMVTIKVNRNRATPSWVVLAYQATILETQTVGSPLSLSPSALNANDQDAQPPNNVVNYRLKSIVARDGSSQYPSEQDAFAVSTSGQVTVRSPLVGLTATVYQVSIIMRSRNTKSMYIILHSYQFLPMMGTSSNFSRNTHFYWLKYWMDFCIHRSVTQ